MHEWMHGGPNTHERRLREVGSTDGRRPVARTLAADQLPPVPLRPGPDIIRVLMIGDVIGKPGRVAI